MDITALHGVLDDLLRRAAPDPSLVDQLAGRSDSSVPRALRRKLATLTDDLKEYGKLKLKALAEEECDREKRTNNDLREEVGRLRKQLETSNMANPECARYVDYINVQNSKIASLNEYKVMYEKLRNEYDVLLGRYEMLRLQYVRVRTEKSVRSISMPGWSAGMPDPCDPNKRLLTNLSGVDATNRAIRKACGDESDSSDSDGEHTNRASKSRALNALKKAKMEAEEAEGY
ncbi:hypothetical protein GHT06_003850 [Daphnia sinensis]|uniref:Uncharacterized protein n=1 Tax=Daphnia sinensis TaxID=1820382 RepID=A0AAD5KDZ2_9CRUS|nr:hypothetical protein GHT06_003850 [Daphnia sinensis]